MGERRDTWRMFELLGPECGGPRRAPEKVVCEAAQGAVLDLEDAGGPVPPKHLCLCMGVATRTCGWSFCDCLSTLRACVPRSCLQ